MELDEIRGKVKDVIAQVGGLDRGSIGDEATLREELNLDSLSLLEIAVEVDLAFKLDLPDERYRSVDTVPAMVALIEERRRELEVVAG